MLNRTEEDIRKNWKKKESRTPLLSIVCLTYNHDKYIASTLDGFLMQRTNFPFEIIVHDDASTDRTVEIIKQYEKKFPNILRPIYEKENLYSKKGGFLLLNKAIEEKAGGKYIAFCEGDDFWIKDDKLQIQADFLEANPEYTAVYHSVYYVKGNKIISNDKLSFYDRDVTAEEIIAGGGEFCSTPSLCFRSAYYFEKWNFKEISDIGDYPMQIILGISGKVRYMAMTAACYRVECTGSWSSRVSLDKLASVRHNKIEIKSMLELNRETERKYENSIYFHIGICCLYLWDMDCDCLRYFFLAARKSGRVYRKRLIKLYHRRILKRKFTRLYKLYYFIWSEIMPAARIWIIRNRYRNITKQLG